MRFYDELIERAVCQPSRMPVLRRADWSGATTMIWAYCKRVCRNSAPRPNRWRAFYEKMSILHRIDGNRDREAVFSEISRLIEDKTPK